MKNYQNYEELHQRPSVPIKMWTKGVPTDPMAITQLGQLAALPVVYPHVAVMPDVHVGIGATVGSVVPTRHAIIPAAVGVDIGCGMMAAKLNINANHLPDSLVKIRSAIEEAVPHGRTNGGRGHDKGAWGDVPEASDLAWTELKAEFEQISDKHRVLRRANHRVHLGTLGTGNHFVELCLDEHQDVWVMLHSGSRGVGNAIGTYFIELAKQDMQAHIANLPHRDLAYFQEGSPHFNDYVQAVDWAQRFAARNRELMMANTLKTLRRHVGKRFEIVDQAVNCHHNYVQKEQHFGEMLYVTRKGAVSAQKGQLGIIPGSMGAKSFIVRGLGNEQSFCSCSHGAGRVMSRTEAKKRITLKEHREATKDVECRKDESVIDESPAAYKPIEAVMAAQSDLVEIVYTLKQVVCVKG
jgi:tRNA-splicing ligase RtcB (3'-phosphate/5'-hydroxy nucleic acid ligase)